MVYKSPNKGMTVIVKTVTRLTLAFILIYGIYIGMTGGVSPGGGFTGGVILALAFVHIMLAFGKEAALRKLRANTLRMVMGPAAFIFLLGVATGRVPEEIGAICEMVIVGTGLFAIFIALVLASKSDRNSE
ncbi:MAG: MnhB domain-containing protein [Candidatus Omnitrophica bacterium]|nr:MnhB domain-containing protein [Candidatus Omnitrophota bacterium]